MKKTLFSIFIAMAVLVSCQDNSPKTVNGIIFDATMNTLSIVAPDGDSLYFGTMDADKSQVNGILIGDTAIVTYTGTLNKTGQGDITSATVLVVKQAPSIIGSWVQPIPGIGGVQGIKMDANGAANSINMYTLVYNGWSKDGNTLILTGQSIGNGQTIDFTEVYTIDKLTADSLVISEEGMGIQRYSRQVVN